MSESNEVTIIAIGPYACYFSNNHKEKLRDLINAPSPKNTPRRMWHASDVSQKVIDDPKQWDYMWMNRCPGPDSIFWEKYTIFPVKIPKTGTLSIGRSLPPENSFGHMYGFYFPKRIRHKLRTMVRNPYDRLVSAYFFMKRGGFYNPPEYKRIAENFESFEDWVLNDLSEKMLYHQKTHLEMEPTILQTEWLIDHNEQSTQLIIPDEHIGRFENLEQDVKRLFNIQKELPKMNVSKDKKAWQTYYTNPKVANKVYKLYKRDFQLLGYEKEI